MQVNEGKVEIEEVSSVLTPAPGVSLAQALLDANITGYDKLEMCANGALITWYKRGQDIG